MKRKPLWGHRNSIHFRMVKPLGFREVRKLWSLWLWLSDWRRFEAVVAWKVGFNHPWEKHHVVCFFCLFIVVFHWWLGRCYEQNGRLDRLVSNYWNPQFSSLFRSLTCFFFFPLLFWQKMWGSREMRGSNVEDLFHLHWFRWCIFQSSSTWDLKPP